MESREMRVLFDAMHHGKYNFDEFLACQVQDQYEVVPWSDRTIYKPSKTLKAFHKFLNSFIFEHLPINDRVAFAYRKGANPHQALLPHASSRAFYQTDLTKFFDSISATLIRDVLEDCSVPVVDLSQYLDRVVELVTVDGCLPIGFSTSPPISNACLKEFDDAFETFCNQHDLIFSRYADDIVVSAKDRGSLADIEEVLSEFLFVCLGQGFKINRSKSKLTTVGRKVKALGMVILPTGQVAIDMEIKRKVEYQLHFYIRDRSRLSEIFKGDLESGMQQLAGHISHIHAADPIYLEKLRKKYGVTVIDGFLRRSAR